jgi:hypothetical protein
LVRSPAPTEASPAHSVSLQFREGFPSLSLQCSVHSTLFFVCLYCSYCLLLSFSFYPRWRSVCPGGYAALAQGFLWNYHGTAKLTFSTPSQTVWARVTGGPGGPPGFSF